MHFTQEELEDFFVIGISARVDMKTAEDLIGRLWRRWFMEDLGRKIKNKVSDDVYNIYTNYEGNQTKPYTCFLGCCVESIDWIPNGMQALDVKGGKYAVFDVNGRLPDVVLDTWAGIYKMDTFERRWAVDFDRYGPEAMNPDAAKLKTYVSIK
jgi:predicted transcriptional regulator YdeE